MPIVDIAGKAVEFPDDLTGDALNDAVGKAAQQMGVTAPRGTGEQAMRATALLGKGLNESAGAAIGAVPDAVTWGLRQFGKLNDMLMPNTAIPRLDVPLPEPGFYTKRAQESLNALGRNDTAETTLEKLAYGAGQGIGNALSVAAPATAIAGLTRVGTTANGVAQALAAQPVMQTVAGAAGGAVGEATDNPWLGAAASMAVPVGLSVARGVVSPGGTRPSPETRRLVDVAKAEGIPLTPGQETGSRPLRTAESVFATLPSTAGRQEAVNDAQRVAFNKAIMARAGETQAERATPDVIEGFLNRAGGAMRDVYERNVLPVDASTAQAVRSIAVEARRELPKDVAKPILNRVEDFIDKIVTPTPGVSAVDGKAFGALDSALSAELRQTMDGKVRYYIGRLQETLRDAFQAGLSGDDAAALALARRQYANGKIIERAMNAQNAQTAAGNIPPASLSQAVAAGAGNRFARGQGDLNDLARVGRAFIQDAIPNSGTPERMAIQNMLTGGALGGGALYGGASIPEAAGLLAAATVGPRVAQSAYFSPMVRNYLTNQVAERTLPRVTPGLLGAAAAANARPLLER